MGILSHIDESGKASMVDITEKDSTERLAVAAGQVVMKTGTIEIIERNSIKKGDVIAVAKLAGIMAAKKVDDLIPLCHKLLLTNVRIDITINKDESCLDIVCSAKTTGRTGVEMEALTGVAVAALTIYDMCKAVDREIIIAEIKLLEKQGGKSGQYKRGKDKG